jgi:hypothetical protein
MMNKIFLIRDLQDNPISTYKKTWCYKTLGIAKAAAKKAGRPYPNLVDNMRAARKK